MDSIVALWDKRKALQKEFDELTRHISRENAECLLEVNQEIQKVSEEIQERLESAFR